MRRTRASVELRKRRAANLESYHRNADRHNKKRYCKRIASGAVPRISSTKRDYYTRIFSPSKYIPEYKAAIGDEALAKYHARMLVHAEATGGQTAERTVSETVLDISVIKSRLPAVKEKFGTASAEYIAALLQTNLWGLRAELGTVKVINRES
eukprot:jgi/Tetstr1/424239/TSEL_001432.t1